ncbi:hypothetical protein CBL_12533 [Carabus blaptoides fortunei]
MDGELEDKEGVGEELDSSREGRCKRPVCVQPRITDARTMRLWKSVNATAATREWALSRTMTGCSNVSHLRNTVEVAVVASSPKASFSLNIGVVRFIASECHHFPHIQEALVLPFLTENPVQHT